MGPYFRRTSGWENEGRPASAGRPRERSGSAGDQVGIHSRDELVRNGVRNHRLETLEHRDPVADFAHDDRDRSLERICHRGEDLTRRLLLTALDLAEVPERDAGLAG